MGYIIYNRIYIYIQYIIYNGIYLDELKRPHCDWNDGMTIPKRPQGVDSQFTHRSKSKCSIIYPLVMFKIVIENGHLVRRFTH